LTMRIMLWVILAMLPAMGVQLYYFGFGVLIQAALAISFALCLEGIVTVLRQKTDAVLSVRFQCDFNCADS
ncbi:electron transport complex protein RnfD, partial [Pasteurella multocida subsp. multocida str. Anand1_cattle]